MARPEFDVAAHIQMVKPMFAEIATTAGIRWSRCIVRSCSAPIYGLMGLRRPLGLMDFRPDSP